MIYFPLLDQFSKFERFIYDFLAYGMAYVVVVMVDAYLVVGGLNFKAISLFVFIAFYLLMRFTIKVLGQESHFGSFVNGSYAYCVFLASFSWIVYTTMIRWQRF